MQNRGIGRRFAAGYTGIVVRDRLYAVPNGAICAIRRYTPPVPLAGAPPEIVGAIAFGGKQILAVDLSQRLGEGPTAVTDRTCLVICRFDAGPEVQEVALLVDDASEVLPESGTGGPASQEQEEAVAVFDPLRFFSFEELKALRVLAAGGDGPGGGAPPPLHRPD